MIYFTADLHFGHKNIIRAARRPFETAEEMDTALIKNWNDRVATDDAVYILGDLTMRGPQYAMQILHQLNGIKYFVRGNHDGFVDRLSFDRSLFQWVKQYHKLIYRGRQFILFHYPIVEWDQAHHGSFHVHGHQHNVPSYNLKNTACGMRRYDVGVDANGMTPVSIEEIISFFECPARGSDVRGDVSAE